MTARRLSPRTTLRALVALFRTGGYFGRRSIAGIFDPSVDRICHLHLYRLADASVDATRRPPSPFGTRARPSEPCAITPMPPKMLNSAFHFILKDLSKVAKL
jgi:hypothetical protein